MSEKNIFIFHIWHFCWNVAGLRSLFFFFLLPFSSYFLYALYNEIYGTWRMAFDLPKFYFYTEAVGMQQRTVVAKLNAKESIASKMKQTKDTNPTPQYHVVTIPLLLSYSVSISISIFGAALLLFYHRHSSATPTLLHICENVCTITFYGWI